MQAGNLQGAILQYEKALQVKIDYPEAQSNLGAALIAVGKPDDALPHVAAAVQLNPYYAEARYNLAVVLASRGKTDEATTQLQAPSNWNLAA